MTAQTRLVSDPYPHKASARSIPPITWSLRLGVTRTGVCVLVDPYEGFAVNLGVTLGRR